MWVFRTRDNFFLCRNSYPGPPARTLAYSYYDIPASSLFISMCMNMDGVYTSCIHLMRLHDVTELKVLIKLYTVLVMAYHAWSH